MSRKPIPIAEAKKIAEAYGYDQIVIYARRVADAPEGGEHLTTYGRTPQHCSVAARMSEVLQRFMGWKPDTARGSDHFPAVSAARTLGMNRARKR